MKAHKNAMASTGRSSSVNISFFVDMHNIIAFKTAQGTRNMTIIVEKCELGDSDCSPYSTPFLSLLLRIESSIDTQIAIRPITSWMTTMTRARERASILKYVWNSEFASFYLNRKLQFTSFF